MLRPIDTQTIYQQSQEISNRQQSHRESEQMQQAQFAQILHKETTAKQEMVGEVNQGEQLDNDLKKQRRKGSESSKKYKKKKDHNKKDEKNIDARVHIDIRI